MSEKSSGGKNSRWHARHVPYAPPANILLAMHDVIHHDAPETSWKIPLQSATRSAISSIV